MRIDLHAHTTASDGLLTADQLIALARESGVGTLGVADHDTTAGLDPALAAGRAQGVEVIPGVEINTDVEGSEVHILGYFIDYHVQWFQRYLQRFQDGRLHRAERMVEKLTALGVPIQMERVLAFADGGAVGRPHVARALLEAGAIRETVEAFERFIGRNGPAYVERLKVTPGQAVRLIRDAGGIPVLAHPGWLGDDARAEELIGEGLEGIEVYYPEHTPAMTERYKEMARRFNLLMTGGTDFHGGDLATRVPLGSQYVPAEVPAALRERAVGRTARTDDPELVFAAD